MRLTRIAFGLAALAVLASCSGGGAFSGSGGSVDVADVAAKFQAIEDIKRAMPVVAEQAVYAKYADLFASTCLSHPADTAATAARLLTMGMRESPVPNVNVVSSVLGTTTTNTAAFKKMSPEFQKIAVALRRESGHVPLIRRVEARSGPQEKRVFADDVAMADVTSEETQSWVCSVKVKTRDVGPLIGEFRRVVEQSGLPIGGFNRSGIIGAGYALGPDGKDGYIAISRQIQTSQSPTSLSIITRQR